MEDSINGSRPSRPYDVNFEITNSGYEVWFSDRIADDHPELVDQCGEWMEELGAMNLGQIDHLVLLADGILTDSLRDGLLDWWASRIEDLSQG